MGKEQQNVNLEQHFAELEKITAPVVKFLKANYNPHTRIVIDFDSTRIVQDVLGVPNKSSS